MSNTNDLMGNNHARGPYVVWLYYGYEGWQPHSYATLKEALLGERYGSSFVVTKVVDFETMEKDDPS